MARTYDPITKKIIDLPDERMVGEPGSGAAATEPAKTYPYGGSYWDNQYMTEDELKRIDSARQAANRGEIPMSQANSYAENIRAGYGYSGGSNGAEYHPLNQPVRTDTTEHTISDVTQRMAAWDQMLNDPYEADIRGLAAQMRDYKPFVDPHQAGLDQLESAILNRKPFEYNLDTDPAWQAYKKQYAREGRRASEDTLGQYAAMTGGIPSTAAATAAQQAANYYNAQMTDKIPELYKLAYSMYADDASRQLSDLNAIRGLSGDAYNRWLQGYSMLGDNLNVYRGLSGDWYGRQKDAYGRLGDLYNLASGERSYADSRADLAYNRAWNEDERDRERAKEDEANTVYGYGSDGSSYKITSQLGRDFIANAKYGDPDMTGGDGSVWHKNADGTVTITRKDGRTYTVSGTPEEWTGLTLAQMWDAIDRATKAGTEIPPNVLKAWEHFMGGSYAGGAPAATGGGYGGGGYDLGGGNENPLAGFGLPAGKWREILGDAQGDKDKAMANLTYYWDVLTDEQRGILAQHAGFQSADLDRLGGASQIGLDVLQGYKDFYADPSAPYATEENEDTAADSNSFMTEKEWKKNKMGYDSYDDYVKAYREWLNS